MDADAITAEPTLVYGADRCCDLTGNNVDGIFRDSVRNLGAGCADGNTTAAVGCSDVCAVE